MRAVYGFVAGTMLLGTVAVASAQAAESGTVVRIDPQSSVVVLQDGRMYRVTPGTALMVDSRPVPLTTLQPGQRVEIRSGEVVVLRDGQYVAMGPPAAGVAPAPPTVLTPAPAAAVPAGVRQTIYGQVEEVESKGEVTIRTEGDTFELKMNPEAMRHIKKGDTVTIDLTFTPPGAPAASTR